MNDITNYYRFTLLEKTIKSQLNLPDEKGITPLMHAVIANQPGIVKKLLACKVNAAVKDKSNRTVLDHAILNNYTGSVRELIKSAPSLVKQVDSSGWTPLFHAIIYGTLPIMRDLIAEGVDINHQDKKGHTALMLAAAIPSIPVIEKLLLSGADVTIWNHMGYTVYDYAIKQAQAVAAKITSLLKQNNFWVAHLYDESHLRRYAAHVMHFKGTTRLLEETLHQKELVTPLEFGDSIEWIPHLIKNISKLPSIDPHLFTFPMIKELEEAILGNRALSGMNFEEVAAKVQSGKWMFHEVGLLGHAVFLVTKENQIAICNRGEGSDKPLELYHFQPKLFTAEIAERLYKMRIRASVNEYRQFMFEELPKKIGMVQTISDGLFQDFEQFAPQSVRNCSLVSLTMACYAFFLIGGINRYGSFAEDKSSPYPYLLAHYRHQSLTTLLQITAIEALVYLAQSSSFLPDHDLIMEALGRALVLPLKPLLKEKLEHLISAYRETLDSPDRSIFNNRLLKYQADASSAEKVRNLRLLLK